MNSRVIYAGALLLLSLLLWQCTEHVLDPARTPPRALTTLEKRLVDADNRFGLKLFRAVNRAEGEKNVFISPLSVSMALGMTLNGAAGETRQAMEQTLDLSGLSTEEINQSYRSLIDLLTKMDPRVQFEIANAIWHRDDMVFEPAFIEANQTFFDAVVRGLDFTDASAVAGIINAWVREHTHDKIDKLLESSDIDPTTVMFLVNAIYFKGIWRYEFEKSKTGEEPFYLPDSLQKPWPMMHIATDLPYLNTADFQMAELPYGDAGFGMIVLLPHPAVDIDSLAGSLTGANWQTWLGRLKTTGVELAFPKFKLEYKIALNEVLKAMGMAVAFSGTADFTRMYAPGGLFISDVKHKTFVEVSEEGTEAAAVTSVEIGRTSVGPEPNGVPMRVDRPFLFAIYERHSNSIVFIGKVLDPEG